MKKYWYKHFVGECPMCGRDASYKIRVYGKKPKNPEKRYFQLSHQQTYDHCMG